MGNNMNLPCKVLALSIAASAVSAGVLPDHQVDNTWFTEGASNVTGKLNPSLGRSAKNIILFVGDGMGVSTLTASRIYQGQLAGRLGEEGLLSFEAFDQTALVKTYNVDAQTPDSAGTMTAMMSGLKTDVGVIGVDEDIERGDCSTVSGNEVITYLELAEIAGLSTGVVSTARITHATPAATYAKSADRNWEDVSDMPSDAVEGGCEDIASQLVNFEANLESRYGDVDVDGIEVAMGGGRRHFLPKEDSFNSPDAQSSVEGDRSDGRDLTQEWAQQYPNGVYVYDQSGFDGIDADSTERVLGLFNESHMQYEPDRGNDIAGEPSLSQMTAKAIDILDNNSDGYFLMVESGRIDHAHHAGSAYGALEETLQFAAAVEAAMNATNADETLILVTADHGHVFTIAGYPKRGNPILGKVVGVGQTDEALANDNYPYTTVGYNNGLGFRDLGNETNADASYNGAAIAGRVDISSIDTRSSGYHQETLVPLSSETHSGEDISLHAYGPGAESAQGVIEQNVVFHIMNQARRLMPQ
jgi:alkaline phosphatase